MSTQAPDRLWSGIDIPKTLAGALAAVCAAVAGSFLGVAGTLAGAAIASIIGTVGTEIYTRSLKRGAEKLQTYAPTFVKTPAAVGTPPVEAATEEEAPSHTVPPTSGGGLRWKRIALVAAAVFVVAVGALSVVELFAQRSVASMVGHDSSGTTTVSSVLDGGVKQKSNPAPTPSATPTETGTTDPGFAPVPQGTEEPTTDPTATTGPSTAPTTGAPTTGAPEQTPPPGTDQGQGGQGGQENRPQEPAEGNE